MFVKRDLQGNIIGICEVKTKEFNESLASDNSELQFFLDDQSKNSHALELQSSDTELARVLEDLIDILTDRGIIHFTDLPAAAQNKLLSRQAIRRNTNSLDLLDEEDPDFL